jgi:hypothetical protein
LPDVLVEQWIDAPESERWGRRVLSDGQVEECSGATAAFVDGVWRFGTQEARWRTLTSLPPAAVKELRSVIRDSGVMELPAEVVPAGTVIGGTEQTWTFALDGPPRQVKLLGVRLDRIPPLAALDTAVQLAVAEALTRGG